MSAAEEKEVAALARDIDMSSLGVALPLCVLRADRARLAAVSADSGVRGGRPLPANWVLAPPPRAAALPWGEPSLAAREAMEALRGWVGGYGGAGVLSNAAGLGEELVRGHRV
jgi:hypothetical protein